MLVRWKLDTDARMNMSTDGENRTIYCRFVYKVDLLHFEFVVMIDYINLLS
ncbi:hypothetical protein D3C71_687730 [compost metagenome]